MPIGFGSWRSSIVPKKEYLINRQDQGEILVILKCSETEKERRNGKN